MPVSISGVMAMSHGHVDPGDSGKSRVLDSTAFIKEGGKERVGNTSGVLCLWCFLHATGMVASPHRLVNAWKDRKGRGPVYSQQAASSQCWLNW